MLIRRSLCHRFPLAYLVRVVTPLIPIFSFGQEPEKTVPDGTEGETHVVIDSPAVKKKPFNEFDFGFTTFKIGVAFLYEYAAFSQDEIGKIQIDSAKVDLKSAFDVRDFRFLFSGKFNIKRTITWKAGLMYDGSLDEWFFRETGLMIAVPELWGSFFVGRTKEGFSLSKVMSGYAIEAMERHMASDPIPIMADGVKWLGFLPRQGIFWNLGVFADWLTKDQSFSTDSWVFVARAGYMPIQSANKNLHIAANLRLGHPEDDTIRLKSRPESNPAPFFIDTGKFPSDQSTAFGGEVYYSSGPLEIGSEYYWYTYNSPQKGDPVFSGGELMASYFFNGGSRPYTTSGGNIYGYVPVKKSVFKGGWGLWEAVLRYSTFDLTDGVVKGGRFWRITPVINWYLADFLRFEMGYGYGKLDRFNMKGATNFFQTRIQFIIK